MSAGRNVPSQGIEGGEAPSQAAPDDMSASELSDGATACVLRYPLAHTSRTAIETNPALRRVSMDVRLTTKEREAIHRRAQGLGLKPSAWGRGVMLDALDKRRTNEFDAVVNASLAEAERRVQVSADVQALATQVRPLAVNVNDLDRRARAGEPVELSAQVPELIALLTEVRGLLGDRVARVNGAMP